MQTRRKLLQGGGVMAALAWGLSARASSLTAGDGDIAGPGVDAYVRSPAIGDASLSPDGRHVAVITHNSGAAYVIVRDLASQKDVAFDLGKKKVRSVFWGSNDHVIVITSLTTDETGGDRIEKSEFGLAHSFNIATGTEYILFSGMAGFMTAGIGNLHRIRHNGTYFLSASNYIMAEKSLQLFDLDTNKATQIDLADGHTRDWVMTPAGVPVARSSFDRSTTTWTLEFCKDGRWDGRWTKVYREKDAIDYPTLIGLGRTEQSVIVALANADAAGTYVEIGANGVASPPLDKGGDNQIPLFHPMTRLFCGFAQDDDQITYAYEDPAIQKLADLCRDALPDQRVTLCEFAAEDPRKVLILGESADDPGTYYIIDLGAGSFVTVGARYPNLPVDWIAARTPVVYSAADGLAIHGYLTLPPVGARIAAKNLPLIVLPHGGPQAHDTIAFEWESQLYASLGYAVLQPNFRGSDGYGQAFVEAGYGQWGRKMQTDLSDGVRWLAGQGVIDPQRVAIVGASYGGYAALAGATLDPGIYRCAVSIAGVSNLKDMMNAGTAAMLDTTSSLYWKRFMGDIKTLDDVSPFHQAKACDIPVLLIHGKDDTVVPIEQSRKMRDALKSAHKDVTLIELAGEDHWESNEDKRLEMSHAVVAFLQAHNPASA